MHVNVATYSMGSPFHFIHACFVDSGPEVYNANGVHTLVVVMIDTFTFNPVNVA